MSDVISGVLLGIFGPLYLALGPNCKIVLLHSTFVLEARLESKSFENLDDLLGFQVQKLWH